MTSHTAHIETLVAPTLINIAAKGRPGDARFHDATRAEAVVLNDTIATPLWRGSALRAEVVAAVATQNFGIVTHAVQRQEFATISDLAEIIGGNQPPGWGSTAGAVFTLKQGESLNLADALRFTDPDGDPLTITQIAGTLPAGTTFNSATGLITADEDATLGLHPEDLVFQADDGQQTVLNVGPTKPYKTIRAAVLAAKDFDTIQIDPGDYIGDVSTLTANNVLIKGTSSTNRARLFANGVHQSDKGIIVLEGDDCTFENMDFHDAEGPSGNIAGVRHDGAGLTTFRRCGFFDCENGILSGGGGTVLLEFCEFARCGYGDGTTHNVYFGNHQMVTARDCYFHEAKIGHEFKSRAKENILERCYFVCGPTGTSSYNVNVDNGGKLTMRGCMLHKGPNADNQNMIYHHTNQWGASFNSILLEHCTLVHDYPSGAFINLASGTTTVTLTACLFASDGRPLVTGTTPVQNSNFHTVVASIPGAENVVDPDFWPIGSIHPDLDLASAVVPTYLVDEPNIFTPRTLTAPPKVIGSIQNALASAWNPFAYPTQKDEQDMYDNVLLWTWAPADKTTEFPTRTSPVGHGNPHDYSEADDLWQHYVQYRRTKDSNATAAAVHLSWAQKWRDYFVSSTYEAEMRGSCPTYGDHMYGPGLMAWGVLEDDAVARDEAVRLFNTMKAECLSWNPTTEKMGGRLHARVLHLACLVSMIDPSAIAARDHIIDCFMGLQWTANTGSTVTPCAIGVMYVESRGKAAGWDEDLFDAGFRWTHSMYHGMADEALWQAYRLTGRADVRQRIIDCARYVLHYAWDPMHPNPMAGGRWGHRVIGGTYPDTTGRNTLGFLHSYSDEFTDSPASLVGIPQNPPPFMSTDPNIQPTTNYESALINGLVYAYKLTGEQPFLDRAKAHLRQATCYIAPASGHPKLAQNEVRKYVDTEVSPDPIYFEWNKGMLQYCYAIFENGGNPTVL